MTADPVTVTTRGGTIDRLRAGVSRTVVVLGAASLFTDVAGEMIAPLRILFLVLVLGTPVPIAGLIEGVAESTASVLKVWSGSIAARVGRRRSLIVAGYGLSNVAKPLLALAGGWPQVFVLVFLDRAGKGLRGAPRDALIAETTPDTYRGKAFGLHRAMDTFGAAFGPLLALLILVWHGQDPRDILPDAGVLRQVFAWTAIPGALGVLVLVALLREPPGTRLRARPAAAGPPAPATTAARHAFGRPFWLFTGVAALFALGNSSDAFIFLRAINIDTWLEGVPLVYFGYNVVYAVLATPLGILSDRWGRVPVLAAGYAAFAVVYTGWALANQGWHIYALFLLYGVYAAGTQGVARAFVVDLVPTLERTRALGWFNGLTGLAALPANVLAGWIWYRYGPGSTFTVGAAVAATAAVLLLASAPRLSVGPEAASAVAA